MKFLILMALLLTTPLFAQLASQDFGADTENITTNEGVPIGNNHRVQVTHKKHHHHKKKAVRK